MSLHSVFAFLAILGGGMMLWQWMAGLRFPLQCRLPVSPWRPRVALLKPLKGIDQDTRGALRSWMRQDYPGELEIIFGVDDPDDEAVGVVQDLLREHPGLRGRLVVCPARLGINRKVSNLLQMVATTSADVLVVSDADVEAPPDLLAQLLATLEPEKVGLAHCLYRFQGAATPAAHWESLVVNADFWSQVLQSQTLGPIRYGLGAAMAFRRSDLEAIGGFESFRDHLADDNQLGRRLAEAGRETALCRLMVDCRVPRLDWGGAWRHQLRWGVTIRVCQPVAHFLSVLANGTIWAVGWILVDRSGGAVLGGGLLVLLRLLQALSLEARALGRPVDWRRAWLPPLKDLLQLGIWWGALWTREIVWRGHRYRVRRDGRLECLGPRPVGRAAAPAAVETGGIGGDAS